MYCISKRRKSFGELGFLFGDLGVGSFVLFVGFVVVVGFGFFEVFFLLFGLAWFGFLPVF